jgi:hypothetical protein
MYATYQISDRVYEVLRHIPALAEKDLVLIRGMNADAQWGFLGDLFYRSYGLPPFAYTEVKSVVERSSDSTIVLDYQPSDHSFKVALGVTQTSDGHQPGVEVLAAAGESIPASDGWHTPTKKPVFRSERNGIRCVVAVAPLTTAIPVPEGATSLSVSFSHFYAAGDGANVELSAEVQGQPQILISRSTPALTDNDYFVWRRYEIPLPPGSTKVGIRVFSGSGNGDADWIAFKDFSFSATSSER